MKTKFLNYSVNKLMLIGFLFQVTNVVGQITVTENGFIYVSNDVLFTTEDIILADNSSKIYLRNEAQLLQKGIDNNNQGIGQISVYQNNNVHEYAYNFWCSPVGNTTNSVINNPFKVNQIHDPLLNTSNPIDSQPALFTTGGQGLSTPLTIAKSWLNIFQAGNSLRRYREYSSWIGFYHERYIRFKQQSNL
jgi:hypothetical protein